MRKTAVRGVALTIGFFDGVHRGHQELLRRVLAAARERGLASLATTFDLHSLEVLHGRGPLRTILTTAEKVATLRSYGVDDVHVFHFTKEFAAQTGQEFVDRVLVEQLGARHIVVGHDFRFGHGRSCGSADMVALAARHKVSVEVVERVTVDGERVSSSALRAAISAGDVALAMRLMGRPYALSGEVVRGEGVGRTLGFPTANLTPDERKLLPATGVYAATAEVAGATRLAVVNIGRRPTVSASGELSTEAHVLDFAGDLYGCQMTLRFHERLRSERRFTSLDALRSQIERDVAAARERLEGLSGGR